MNFNEKQIEAINHTKGACGVIATAGAGKSTVLVNRIKNLVDNGVDPSNIAAISFTRNSAQDLKLKLASLGINGGITVGTFHSICAKIMINNGYSLNSTLYEFEIENEFKKVSSNEIDMKEIMSYIGYQKNYMRSHDDEFVPKKSKYTEDELRTFYKTYEDLKKKKNYYDFDDYLLIGYELMKNNPFNKKYEYILVDEHQDSNKVQCKLINLLCPSGNVFAVFDFRQAIYGFRGGNVEYCLNFKKDYPNAKIIDMNINYRSKNKIVLKSNDFMKQYYGDYEFYSDAIPFNQQEEGIVECEHLFNEFDEADYVVSKIEELVAKGAKYDDIAVLYRLNSNVDYIENELQMRDIPYYIENDAGFFKRKEVLGILAMLRLVNNPDDDVAFEEVFNFRAEPFMYIPKAFIANLKNKAKTEGTSLLAGCKNITKGYINTSTTNKVKLQKFAKEVYRISKKAKEGTELLKILEDIYDLVDIYDWIECKSKSDVDIEERKKSMETMKNFTKDKSIEQFINFAYTNNTKKKKKENSVQLMTIHKSKGLQWKNTFVIGLQDEVFPHKDSDIMEEARLMYVAVTRAENNLFVTGVGESRFLDEYRG